MDPIKKEHIRVHIKYQEEMTLSSLEDSLRILNEAFIIYHEESQMILSESNDVSPKVISVSNGSFVVDVVVPITCSLLPILYDIIKNHFSSGGDKYKVEVKKRNAKIKWTDDDNYQISKAILKEYVINQADTPVGEFIEGLTLQKPYGRNSIRAKIQNTKYLMENDQISNTLHIAGRDHCSKTHRIHFAKACGDLGI